MTGSMEPRFNTPPDVQKVRDHVTSLCNRGFWGDVTLQIKDGKVKRIRTTEDTLIDKK